MKRFTPEIIAKAIKLRKSGLSLSEISNTINVSKNTVYHWVSNIILTRRQKERLHYKEVKCGKRGLRKAHRMKQIKILKWKENVLSRAEKYKGICAVQYNSTDLQYGLQLIGESIYSMKD